MPIIFASQMVLQTPATSGGNGNIPPFPLTHARIGYNTIATESNVTASSEAAGFPAEAAVNPFTYEGWKPAVLPATWSIDYGETTDVDYIGIAAHTFHVDRCTLSIEYSIDGSTWTTLRELAPGDGAPIMLVFNPITARYWQFTVDGLAAPVIGVIFVGRALAMQRAIYGGHAPITLNRKTTIVPVKTEAGQFLGRSIVRQGNATTFEWKNLTAGWYRQYFDPFVKYARRFPFFIAWRPATFPNEVGYVWTTSDISPSNMGIKDYMQVSLSVEGLTDEP